MYPSVLKVVAIAIVGLAAVPAQARVQERQLDSIFSEATSGAASVASVATSAVGSAASDVTSFAGSVATHVETVGGSVFTVVTSAGGSAITLGTAVVETFAGSVYTVASNAAASVTSSSAARPLLPIASGVTALTCLATVLVGIAVGAGNIL